MRIRKKERFALGKGEIDLGEIVSLHWEKVEITLKKGFLLTKSIKFKPFDEKDRKGLDFN
ncbi:MAG: hypothetical protein K2L34_07370 [Muribaculaceae bacterium]|nr:hypothetical protein [Muribaculaceae bacterium]